MRGGGIVNSRPQTEPSSNPYYRRLLPPLNLVERSPSLPEGGLRDAEGVVPYEQSRNSFRRRGDDLRPTGGGFSPPHSGKKSPSGGDEAPWRHPREGARLPHEESPTKNRKTSEPRRGFGKRTVRRFIVGFLAEFSWLWSICSLAHKRSTCKVANFFFATFFLFGKEKRRH